ncbi:MULTISPECIES: DUF4395 domain-containing protein [Nocardiopsis]|uniref:DUF4395 domain-containing protein n=1 Tax=Nocardiopsis sinuspersici TaxID=501010 RepID=A0A1V3C528_9ACTN|nr:MULTISPECIES: DUF4395 domain-containing protein [Nocardiopsis]OOC55793.1 hypothetical protein NOSIN_19785 [Nocardiopsis sinuspersici]
MQVDPRGQRFAAALTTLVLATALATGNLWVLGFQALVFAAAVVMGVRRSPYGLLFAVAVRPRIGPASSSEDARPPRFAQGVGLLFAVLGLVGYLAGPEWLGISATALALFAAFLNAVFGYCAGCETYLLGRRLLASARTA